MTRTSVTLLLVLLSWAAAGQEPRCDPRALHFPLSASKLLRLCGEPVSKKTDSPVVRWGYPGWYADIWGRSPRVINIVLLDGTLGGRGLWFVPSPVEDVGAGEP